MKRFSRIPSAILFVVMAMIAPQALATQVFRCDQLTPDPYGFRERIFVAVDDPQGLIGVRDFVTRDDTPRAFEGWMSRRFEPALPSSDAATPDFSYVKSIPEEGGLPDTRIEIRIRFQPGFAGTARLQAVFNGGLGGVDEYDLGCRSWL